MTAHEQPASLARRALPALLLAVAGGAVLGQIDRPGGGDAASATPSGTGSTAPAEVPATTTTVPQTSATFPSFPGPQDPGGAPPPFEPQQPQQSDQTTASADDAATTVPGADAGAAGSCGDTTDGDVAQTRYGPLQVEASFTADGSICDVQAIQYPSSDRKSIRINERALPVIAQQVLAVQSANFDGVSGATITSEAYRASLQSILDNR